MHKHKAVKTANGSFVLVRDGLMCQCPKSLVPITTLDTINNQMRMVPTQVTCSTICPFATVSEKDEYEQQENGGSQKKEEKGLYYTTRCEGSVNEIKLDEIEDINKKKPAIIHPIKAAEA